MSADNYYEINTEQQGDGSFRFGVNMGYASDEHTSPLPNTKRTRWFSALEEAEAHAAAEQAEYGWSIVRNAAWAAYERAQRADVTQQVHEIIAEGIREAVVAERGRIVALLRQLAEGREDYVHAEDERSDNYSIRQTWLILSSEVAAMRTAAAVIESGSVEEVQGWLPSWRWQDKALRELGLNTDL